MDINFDLYIFMLYTAWIIYCLSRNNNPYQYKNTIELKKVNYFVKNITSSSQSIIKKTFINTLNKYFDKIIQSKDNNSSNNDESVSKPPF